MSYYYSANDFYRKTFGKKVIKLALDGGFTCPNRDGTLSKDGCIFCSSRGSGDFAGNRLFSIDEQIEYMKQKMSKKWKDGIYMAYFQAFTNTYAPIKKLEEIFTKACSNKDIKALCIATRPDCIYDETIELLKKLSEKRYVCIELGLQTSNEKTAYFINRQYDNSVFKKCVKKLNEAKIPVTSHIIIGLPNENINDMANTLKFAVKCGVSGIKLQMLHIIKETPLSEIYNKNPFKILSLSEYAEIIVHLIELTPSDIVIHRITGDGPKHLLIAPLWTLNKKNVLNTINRTFKEKNTFQGRLA